MSERSMKTRPRSSRRGGAGGATGQDNSPSQVRQIETISLSAIFCDPTGWPRAQFQESDLFHNQLGPAHSVRCGTLILLPP